MSVEETLDDLTKLTNETAEIVNETVGAVATEKAWRCGLSQKQHVTQILLVSTIAGAIGGVAAYYICKKKMETKYEAILEKEIAEAKAFYSTLHKKDEFETPEKAVKSLGGTVKVKDAAEALLKYQGQDDEGEPLPPEEEETVVVESSTNVFVQRDNDTSSEISMEEINARTPDKPYIISQEEFFVAEPGFEQNSITYYAGDGTLADEKDEEIPYVDPIVGAENLEYFGYGSGDSRIVYIRNERLSLDFEVVKSDGKFAHEVLGFEHSDGGSRGRQQRNELRKFRGGTE